jgi:1-phosphatidylinositol-3-phosphate 5-kinase
LFKDDRFIAKEISRTEMQSMEMFAPAYFDYMSSAITAKVCLILCLFPVSSHATRQRPTLLAKVFGCYKLIFKKGNKDKNPSRSKSTQMNLLVMENLFYDRGFSKVTSGVNFVAVYLRYLRYTT